MAFAGNTRVLFSMYVFVLLVAMVYGYVINKNDENTVSIHGYRKSRVTRSNHETSIRRFAIHDICRNHKGQKYLYRVLKLKLCNIKASFIGNLVVDLCKKDANGLHKETLFAWVKELFDIDDNNRVSYFEKHYYGLDF